ncbi:alanine--tRNA ligase [Opitutaceae bacterium]|nr:alanine--tRNA ligase [Opitutaceae bacterium]
MTSTEIRQSFLDFFAAQKHTVVPSASLMPDSPGLLFTNAGMNQFVPFFLGDKSPDVDVWAGAIAASNQRATDTQKCIRAGGKHNDLEDVGYDTYHHTLFEMLGNWSFGDYFKEESIRWGWELLTKVWGMPAKRLFATVYSPDAAAGDPASFDDEAYAIWKSIFEAEGLDPDVHIVNGNKKDNFWMMGDTGPCGPCSEVHFNLLADDDEQAGRKLVNQDSPRCIEIWNHVFIQFNANADGTFSPLAAKHVDTGMGFERVAGIYASTDGFKDFSAEPSNYAADIFAPLFTKIAELSGQSYAATVPTKREGLSAQERTDIAFRVIADHARCVSCAIADNILPGNEGRNYVIRRILRRGILYGKKLGLQTGFFEQLVAPVVSSLGSVFPELEEKRTIITKVIHAEEENFGRTLDRGLAIFNEATKDNVDVSGEVAFQLYDTFGFPLDMTELLATERGLQVDKDGFDQLMTAQRDRARAAQKKEVVVAATEDDQSSDLTPTDFVGYDKSNLSAHSTNVVEIISDEDASYLVTQSTPFYAEMGGQAGDHGSVTINDATVSITDTVKDKAGRFLHQLEGSLDGIPGASVELSVDVTRRRAISRHHSATHLIHWALRKVLGTHVHQAGTHKTPDRLRFDFAHFEAMTPEQLSEVELLVNQQVIDNAAVETYETDFDQKPEGTLAFFGEKYGKIVRVVDMGGYSRELCGGTHVDTTGEIGLIKIVAESAIAAGTRRIEAVAGAAAYTLVQEHENVLRAVSAKLHAGPQDVDEKLTSLLAQKAAADQKLKGYEQKASANLADDLISAAVEKEGLRWISRRVEAANPNALRALGSQIISQLEDGVVILGAAFGEKVSVVAFCSPAAIEAGHQAGKLVSERSVALGGKGGGKPDFAMGGGRDASKLDTVLKMD